MSARYNIGMDEAAENDVMEITWNDFDFLSDRLIESIEHQGLEFDTILGIGRGGLIAATVASYKLDVKNLQNFGLNTRHTDKVVLYQKPNVFGKVLVIDDINDTGKTFSIVKKYLAENYDDVQSVKYASLILRNGSSFKEDILYGNEFFIDHWFTFPWDK